MATDTTDSSNPSTTSILDKNSDTKGLVNEVDDATDWTDVVHSKRKQRDRLLDDNVVLQLCQKSDWEGFKRLFTNVGLLYFTRICIDKVWEINEKEITYKTSLKWIVFAMLYVFYGFQIQCFGYAAQHELMHRTAFHTRWLNDMFLFIVSIPCFEFGKHEKAMHKQHHTYTNNINRDPELTSFWSTAELEKPGFRKVASSRSAYVMEYIDLYGIMKSHIMRIVNSARGKAVDYTGVNWSLKEWCYDADVLLDLQRTAQFQLAIYFAIAISFGTSEEGRNKIFFYWLLPAIIGFIPINYVRNAEHGACEVSTEMNCLRNTRSVRSNILIRQLMWNMNLHAEHHLYPMIPFFNLPKLSILLQESLKHNDIPTFAGVNCEYVKTGGWIDLQNSNVPYKKTD